MFAQRLIVKDFLIIELCVHLQYSTLQCRQAVILLACKHPPHHCIITDRVHREALTTPSNVLDPPLDSEIQMQNTPLQMTIYPTSYILYAGRNLIP